MASPPFVSRHAEDWCPGHRASIHPFQLGLATSPNAPESPWRQSPRHILYQLDRLLCKCIEVLVLSTPAKEQFVLHGFPNGGLLHDDMLCEGLTVDTALRLSHACVLAYRMCPPLPGRKRSANGANNFTRLLLCDSRDCYLKERISCGALSALICREKDWPICCSVPRACT